MGFQASSTNKNGSMDTRIRHLPLHWMCKELKPLKNLFGHRCSSRINSQCKIASYLVCECLCCTRTTKTHEGRATIRAHFRCRCSCLYNDVLHLMALCCWSLRSLSTTQHESFSSTHLLHRSILHSALLNINVWLGSRNFHCDVPHQLRAPTCCRTLWRPELTILTKISYMTISAINLCGSEYNVGPILR